MSGFEKFRQGLPSKDKFYSSLMIKRIIDEDYELALKVWNKLEMKTMKYDHDLCSKWDVLLLTDVFEKFKNIYLKK